MDTVGSKRSKNICITAVSGVAKNIPTIPQIMPHTMRLINTVAGPVAERDGQYFPLADDWDALVNHASLAGYLRDRTSRGGAAALTAGTRPPLASQEVWAAGVTYKRSKTARMEESTAAASCYDRVYASPRR